MLVWVLLRRTPAASDSNLGTPHQPRLSPDTGGRGAGRRALGRAQLGKRLALPNVRYFSTGHPASGHMLPPPPCACCCRLALSAPSSRLAFRGSLPTGLRLERTGSSGEGSYGFRFLSPVQRRCSVLWVGCAGSGSGSGSGSSGGAQAMHPSAGDERMAGEEEAGVNQLGKVPGPQSCAGNLSWKSLLLHPGHFKQRWRQTARGCRPDGEPPSF
ncbi:hypothetical protein HJG60_010170 [Phyllostomus discolor]|uniref:Uncharacterized protein n=1 Tax=Phyllostomus discolor TaxID=89673 RepID=A0A834AZH6_9CHIR|nr:hypothetical protein HJG60_010170 [Phyllostomus discolor]